MKLKFSLKVFAKPQISSFIKIRSVEAELFHADGWTDGLEANSRSSQFCERA
jgi:hypothetical protein